ncbi:MAG: hypothetical protein ABEJ65_07680 [bacterium]
MKILYIAGLAHSGSTYLSRVLNQHSDILSVGEIVFLPKSISGPINCPCTENSDSNCSLWPEVLERCSIDDQKARQIARLSMDRRLEWIKAVLGLYSKQNVNSFGSRNLEFFRTISEVSGSEVILDASKTIWRVLPLWKSLPEHVYLLHLVKMPENQLESRMRMGYNFWHSLLLKYARKNTLYEWFFSNHSTYKQVRFEDLVNHPESTIEAIHHWINLDYENPFDGAHKPFHHLQGNAQAKGSMESLRPLKEKLVTHRDYTPMQQRALSYVKQQLYPKD